MEIIYWELLWPASWLWVRWCQEVFACSFETHPSDRARPGLTLLNTINVDNVDRPRTTSSNCCVCCWLSLIITITGDLLVTLASHSSSGKHNQTPPPPPSPSPPPTPGDPSHCSSGHWYKPAVSGTDSLGWEFYWWLTGLLSLDRSHHWLESLVWQCPVPRPGRAGWRVSGKWRDGRTCFGETSDQTHKYLSAPGLKTLTFNNQFPADDGN